MGMKLNATLETKTSKKGTAYQCVVIKLTDTLEKIVFLEPAEVEILKLVNTEKNISDFPDLSEYQR